MYIVSIGHYVRKKASSSFIAVDHQVRDEYEIVFAYARINIPLPGSTNNNYNSFDNNDSDDSGSLSDYSLHDESVTVTDITQMRGMNDDDDGDDEEGIVKGVRRYKLPDEVSCKSKEDDGVCIMG
jgi:hypothetical protein